MPEAKANSCNGSGQERKRETEETTTMTRINKSVNLLACLLAAIAHTLTNAKPITLRDRAWNEKEAESLKHLALEGSKFLRELAKNPDDGPHASRSDYDPNKTAEKTAIIGGTVACGVIIGIGIFLGVLFCKRRIASRKVESKAHVKSSKRDSVPETTTDGTCRDTWRDTFNHRIPTPRTPGSESVSSEQSFGTMSTDGQVNTFAPGKWSKIVANDSVALGVNQENHIDSSSASSHQLVSPLVPKALRQITTYKGPLATETPSDAIEMTPKHPHRESGISVCTMSTLGRDLLRDTRHPPAPAKYSLFPKCEPRTETTRAETTLPGRAKQSPPAAMDNPKKPGRMSSRRYFVPLFRSNGQLLSPTSPEESVGMGTVVRDESRANMFSLGENKI